jgi:Ser/Thr protein kinase RdoA (MazF antagonist)
VEDQSHRERFDAQELAIVLSHYELGVIEQLRVFPRGSRRSPKLRIKSKQGEFLLKRRAPGQDDPYRVAFAHDLQLHLGRRGYPVAGLIGTRDDNNSMLQLNGRTYELFNYVQGTRYDKSPWAAREAGAALGRLHASLTDYQSMYDSKVGSFHAAPEIDAKTALIPVAVGAVEPQADRRSVTETAEFLRRAYVDAAKRANECGLGSWPKVVLHGDWHPGNLLFRREQVAGVLDFDSARLEPRVIDVANAILQFSMPMTSPDDPAKWPDDLDLEVIRCMLGGYDEASGKPLTSHERTSLPWLMIEALIIESVVPIAATGSFARLAGSAFLEMIERKVKWIRPRATALAELGMMDRP